MPAAVVDGASSSDKATAYKPAVDNAVNVVNKLIDGYTNANARCAKSRLQKNFLNTKQGCSIQSIFFAVKPNRE
jgi:uncharacterized protein (DUF983 family)